MGADEKLKELVALQMSAFAAQASMMEQLATFADRARVESRVLPLALMGVLLRKGLITREELDEVEKEIRAAQAVEDAVSPEAQAVERALAKYRAALKRCLPGEGGEEV
jgi:hypothetical protein